MTELEDFRARVREADDALDAMVHDPDEWPDFDHLRPQRDYIFEQDWDCLIVLDAMRFDAMLRLARRRVKALHTPSDRSTIGWIDSVICADEWLADGDIPTYVAGNPQAAYIPEYEGMERPPEDYVNVIPAHDPEAEQNAWDQLLGTSRPDEMAEITGAQEPPVIAHFMQPHTPYIGEVGFRVNARNTELMSDHGRPNKYDIAAEEGYVSDRFHRQSYFSNAQLAWRFAKQTAERFGKTVVTSDHGERLGPRGWDHAGPADPRGQIVPWVEI